MRYHHFTHGYQSYDVCFLKYKVWQREIFVILGHFALSSSWQPKNQNFKIKKKTLEILYIILNIYTINDNHMMYGSWDIECDRQNFLPFWTVFCPFTPYGTRKLKFWKNEKKPEDIIILEMCTINDNHMINDCWDMKHDD